MHCDVRDRDARRRFDNIVLTHVLEHLDDPVGVLKRINDEWLTDDGRFFLVCPNANAPSRQIAVKMGLITHNAAVTPAEAEHGHRCTYSLDTLERDAVAAGLKVVHRSGIFFKALANFQWDRLLKTDIISTEYLEGCYRLGQQYPDLCSSIFLSAREPRRQAPPCMSIKVNILPGYVSALCSALHSASCLVSSYVETLGCRAYGLVGFSPCCRVEFHAAGHGPHPTIG